MRVGLDADILVEGELVLWLAMALKDMSNEVVGWPAAVPSASLRTSYAFVGLWEGGDAGLLLLLMMVLGTLPPSEATLCALLMMGLSPATIVLSGIARLASVAVVCVSPFTMVSAGTFVSTTEYALDSVPVSAPGRGSAWTMVVI